MKKVVAIASLLWLGAAGFAAAESPQLNVKKSITIAAPADKVWDTVKDFNGWTHWHPALASDEIVSGTNNAVGAVRLLTLKGGGTISGGGKAYGLRSGIARPSSLLNVVGPMFGGVD